MDVNIPEPNEALTALLVSARMRAILDQPTNAALMLYQAEVVKRTGRLAASAHASTEIGGVRQDRWIGVLTVGGAGPLGTADYAAAHQFGHWQHDRNHPGEWTWVDGHHDLNRVLEQLGSL